MTKLKNKKSKISNDSKSLKNQMNILEFYKDKKKLNDSSKNDIIDLTISDDDDDDDEQQEIKIKEDSNINDIILSQQIIKNEVNNKEEEVNCPICQLNLNQLSISIRSYHVNNCIEIINGEKSIKRSISINENKNIKIKKKNCSKKKSLNELNKDESNPVTNTDNNIIKLKKIIKIKKPIPDYKILKFENNFKIAVDAFNYEPDPSINYYVLTHFHSDHYMGITRGWTYRNNNNNNNDNDDIDDDDDDDDKDSKFKEINEDEIIPNTFIICSKITKNLLIYKFKISSKFIISMDIETELNLPINSNDKDKLVKIKSFDANHCPGSLIFNFESNLYKYLHCGDFRVNKSMILKLKNFKYNKIYLDTTYLSSLYNFPKQNDVINSITEFCFKFNNTNEIKSNQKKVIEFFKFNNNTDKFKTLIVIGTYSIGKERIAISIAKRLNLKIYCNFTKRETIKLFEWNELIELINDDPFNSQIHLVPMRDITNLNSVKNYFKNFSKKFNNIIAITPTGWTFNSKYAKKEEDNTNNFNDHENIIMNLLNNKSTEFNINSIESNFKKDSIYNLIKIPYSEHSSFRELTFFSIFLNYNEIIPTVNLNEINKLLIWIKLWKKFNINNISNENNENSLNYSLDNF
ncbi:catalytic activity protein [[Candida] boidinii]|nr:catalytic activity protein [[Candida] boidinii]